ncbi:MAG: hypothetical protein KY457_02150 [Actinobacteria bacterium]|nr:hypothetical protein [Actinomycetota bacterium]
MSALAITLTTGLALGAVYALVGAAVATVAVATRTLHLAIGQLLVAGVLVHLVLSVEAITGMGPLGATVVAVAVGAATSAVLVPALLRRLPPGLHVLVGLAVAGAVIEAVVARTLGTRTVRPAPVLDLPPLGTLEPAVTAALLLGLPAAALLGAAVRWSRWGRQLRLVGGSARAAELAGVAPLRVTTTAFAVAGGVTVLAGLLIAPVTFAGVSQGAGLTVRGVAAAALLGRGGPAWALPAGLVLGLAEASAQSVWPAPGGDVAVALVVIAVLVLRGPDVHRARGRAW